MATEPAPTPKHARRKVPGSRLRTEWVLLGVALALLAYVVAPVLLLVFAGIALAVALDGLAVIVSSRTPVSRGWALLVISLLLVALLVVFALAIAPQVAAQMEQMRAALDTLFESAIEWLGDLGMASDMMEANGEDLAGPVGTVMSYMAQWGMSTLGALTSVLVLLAVAGFAAADPALYRRGLLGLLPHGQRPHAEATLTAAARALRWWFLSQLVSMLLLGVTVSLGLWVIGIDLWLGLGLLTALLTFVPYLGPLIAAIPVLAVGFTEGVNTGLIVTAFYLVVQNIEGNLMVPWIQHKVVHLAPVVAISAQLLLGLLFGLPGFILAAPLTVVGMVLVQKLWVEAVLDAEGAEPG